MEIGESSGAEAAVVRRPSMKASYRSLPHKSQLLILMLARFTDSLATSSIHAYMFFQLQYLSPSAPIATITTQCGFLIGCRTGVHVCTGLVWGRLADRVFASRKVVLVLGLVASSVATFGYGFSRTFYEAIAWQTLDGALNATVAMVRCMTAALNPEKQFRVRAFTLLPLFANIGSMLGPLLGGFLVRTETHQSRAAGYPYALPNICIAIIQALIAIAAILLLTDTSCQPNPDCSRNADVHVSVTTARSAGTSEHPCNKDVSETTGLLQKAPRSDIPEETQESNNLRFLSLKTIWQPNVMSTMTAHFIISGHLGTFATLWAMLLSLPTASSRAVHLPFKFSGGLGLQPHTVGIAMSIFSFTSIVLQIVVYPSLQARWGTIQVWRAALCLFPFVYFAAPFCALVPSLGKDSNGAVTGAYLVLEWSELLGVLLLFAVGRTGVVPATSLLINECTPHPSVRGTVHATGVICSNLSRCVFPPTALAVMGIGLRVGIVGLGFWSVAVLAIASIAVSLRVCEGTNGE
ncbi:major facilitator superfamily domain-containing protein [Boeremia exigua]|uniref:major facilitator superfamily domain-containing protein n=1 Tax=Boeremia exigua TaxID=749465 RepID=UPI001E8D599A|nr:major facilitator superfamily domain-containing protein [Boeremia exigua]KAH6629752.1 major facilitator superfamily domain-containing protein [Boeremia exigua]